MSYGTVDPAEVEALFHSLADLEEEVAQRVLEQRCRATPALRVKVERLLRHDRLVRSGFLSPDGALLAAAVADVPRIEELHSEGRLIAGERERVGRYRLLRPLGQGAMGVVHVAYDEALDRRVALKVLRQGFSMSASLGREARALARVTHPNVVQVYELGEHDGQSFVAMELVPGRSLREWLAETPRSVVDVLWAFVQAGRGLAAIHDAGIVHRDFKPDNVLVGVDGRVRVADLGISAFVEREEPSDSGVLGAGTPAFMAPEQFLGKGAEAASDQFAFCVSLYRSLFARAPFAGEDLLALRRSVLSAALVKPPPSRDVPPWVGRVLTRGLSPSPAARFPSMTHLVGAIERRLPLPEHDPSMGRRERRLLSAALASLGVATLVFLVASTRSHATSPTMRQLAIVPSGGLACHAVAAVLMRRRLLGNQFAQRILIVVWVNVATVALHRLLALHLRQAVPDVLVVDMMIIASQQAMAAMLFEPWFAVTAALFVGSAIITLLWTKAAVGVMLGSVAVSYALCAFRIGL